MLNTPYALLFRWFYLGFMIALISMFFLDSIVYQILNRTLSGQRVFWEKVTYLGDSEWMAIACLIAIFDGLLFSFFRPNPIWSKMWRMGIFTFVTVALVGLSALLLKSIIGRARPYIYDSEGPLSFAPFGFDSLHAAFPSGHTTTAFSLATVLAILFPRLSTVVFGLAIVAGFSRMALNAHYLADVIFGATFGIVCTIAFAKWFLPKLKI